MRGEKRRVEERKGEETRGDKGRREEKIGDKRRGESNIPRMIVFSLKCSQLTQLWL